MQSAVGERAFGAGGQRLRVQAGVSKHRVTLRKLMNGGGAELVRLRHRTGRTVRSWQIAAGKIRDSRLMPYLRHSGGNSLLHFRCRIIGEGMAEILHYVQP